MVTCESGVVCAIVTMAFVHNSPRLSLYNDLLKRDVLCDCGIIQSSNGAFFSSTFEKLFSQLNKIRSKLNGYQLNMIVGLRNCFHYIKKMKESKKPFLNTKTLKSNSVDFFLNETEASKKLR